MLPRTCATLVLGWIGRHFREWSKILKRVGFARESLLSGRFDPASGENGSRRNEWQNVTPASCILPPASVLLTETTQQRHRRTPNQSFLQF